MARDNLIGGGFFGNRSFLVTKGLASSVVVASETWTAPARGVAWDAQARAVEWDAQARSVDWTTDAR